MVASMLAMDQMKARVQALKARKRVRAMMKAEMRTAKGELGRIKWEKARTDVFELKAQRQPVVRTKFDRVHAE
jgi:hypothetical protein